MSEVNNKVIYENAYPVIDVSFEAWLKNSNNINKEYIIKKFDEKERELKKNNKDLDFKQWKKRKLQLCDELIAENKKILQFKKLRKYYKICKESIDLLGNEITDHNKYNETFKFLEGYKNILDNKNYAKESFIKSILLIAKNNGLQTLCNILLDKTKKCLESYSKKINKDSIEYLKVVKSWYSAAFKSLEKNVDNVRLSKSDSFEKTAEEVQLLSTWMSKFKDSKLKELAIISSHNAGSYSMDSENYHISALGKAAKTQKLNFIGQLKSGVRHFDFRMRLEKSVPVFFHGPINGAPVTEAISQLMNFISQNRSNYFTN